MTDPLHTCGYCGHGYRLPHPNYFKRGIKACPTCRRKHNSELERRRKAGLANGRMATGKVSVNEAQGERTRQRVWCPRCKAFTILPDEQECPRGHVRERGYHAVEVGY